MLREDEQRYQITYDFGNVGGAEFESNDIHVDSHANFCVDVMENEILQLWNFAYEHGEIKNLISYNYKSFDSWG